MSIQYTRAQQAAVSYADGDLLMSAAAGSGKTAALTGRITELILSGRARLSEMLVVTFTRAAASEMRGRIMKRLQEEAENAGNDAERAERISRAISEVPSADICTIDSFLLKILRPRFPALGLSPDTRIGEQRVLEIMRTRTMKETVDDFFNGRGNSGETEDFVSLVDVIGRVRDTRKTEEEFRWLADKLTGLGLDEKALAGYAARLEESAEMPLLETEYGQAYAENIRRMLRHYGTVFSSLREELITEPEISAKYATAFGEIDAWLAAVGHALDENNCEMFNAAAASYDPQNLPPVKKGVSETAELFKFFRKEFKGTVDALAATLPLDEAETADAARRTAALLRSAERVCGEYFKRLSEAKRDAGLLDYSDLYTLSGRLFVGENGEPTDAAREAGAAYRYLFVDEYQDTNGIQDRLFTALFPHCVRFMVGDVKQSIYRFRGADPAVFTRYRASWKKITPETVESGEEYQNEGHSLFLSENFRCAEPVIAFTNAVSEAVFPGTGTPFEKDDRLIHARTEKAETAAKPVEVCLIDTKTDEEEDAPKYGDPEAEYVAERILEMTGRYDETLGRFIRPSDIAVLLRSPSSNGVAFREALERRGVAAQLQNEKPLDSYPAVMLLICLLNLADNPLREITAAGAMRSPVFGFSMDDLETVRKEADSMPFYYGAVKIAEWDDERVPDAAGAALRDKCRRLTGWQKRHAAAARSLTTDKYLEYLMNDTEFFSLPGIRGNGVERDAVNRFTALASGYEQNMASAVRFGGLAGFLSYIAETISRKEEGKKASETADAVSIMSIHGSKGLEFPVCFVSGCGKKRNIQDETRTILLDGGIGIGMLLPDDKGTLRYDTLIRRAIAGKIRAESVDEEMRMLYVALTRARERLIVTGKLKSVEKRLGETAMRREFADEYTARELARDYLDWILVACGGDGRYWTVRTVLPGEIGSGTADDDERREVLPDSSTGDIAARFSFEYPDRFLSGVPLKLTVSRLNPRILDDAESDGLLSGGEEEEKRPDDRKLERPQFMAGKPDATAAERGTATHAFLQFADFEALRAGGFEKERDRLVEKKYLFASTASLIDGKLIERFTESDLFDRILRSPMVKREFRFNTVMEAARFTADAALAEKLRRNGTMITVQGVVDCVFRDPDTGSLTLIDYKTDAILAGEWHDQARAEKRLADRHRDQLTYYREICEAMFGEKIPLACIYSVPLGRTIPV